MEITDIRLVTPLILVVLSSLIQEIDVFLNVLIVGTTACQRFTCGRVYDYIEGLGIGTKLMALQVAPLGTDGAQRLRLSLHVSHLIGFCQRCLVVDVEGDEHKVPGELLSHCGVSPYSSLHLATVHTAKASEVDEHGLALSTSGSHTCLVVSKASLNHLGIEVEVLCVHGWGKSTHGLAGSTPQSWHHIDGKGQRHQSTHDTDHGHWPAEISPSLVALELQPPTEVGAQEGKDDNPQRKEHLAIEQVPAIGKVSHREELQGKGQFDESCTVHLLWPPRKGMHSKVKWE